MIRAVLFDLGGTLHVSTNSQERKRWFARRLIDRLAEYGIPLDVTPEALSGMLEVNAEVYKRESEASLRELPSEVIWNDFFLKDFRIGRERLRPMAEELSFLYDYERPSNMRRAHLIECMEALKAQNVRTGVISNIISRSIVPHFLVEYGLERYMECVITSAETGVRKPSAEIFRIAERQMNLKPEEMAYVGDTISRDVRGVRNAGWRLMIQIENPLIAHRDAGMQGLGYAPDFLIRDLMEVPEIIARVRANDD